MQQHTNVRAVGFSAASATILMWQMGYHWPEMMATAPAGLEAAFVGVIATVVARYFPRKREKLAQTDEPTDERKRTEP